MDCTTLVNQLLQGVVGIVIGLSIAIWLSIKGYF